MKSARIFPLFDSEIKPRITAKAKREDDALVDKHGPRRTSRVLSFRYLHIQSQVYIQNPQPTYQLRPTQDETIKRSKG